MESYCVCVYLKLLENTYSDLLPSEDFYWKVIKIEMIIYFQNRQLQCFKVHLTILRFLDQSAS